MTSSGVLAAITAAAKRSADVRERMGGHAVEEVAATGRPRGAEFRARLQAPRVCVIAECKRRSPSRGILRDPYDPASIARGYAAAGAAAISVITENTFFDGSLDHLSEVRQCVEIPVLRKDFISTPFQILEARAAGADAILLIVAALDRAGLNDLLAESARQGLAALVEVHSMPELEEALAAGADLVGVNSRNLKTLDVDVRVFDQVRREIPDGVVTVAESGLRSAEDIRRLRAAGYNAFLIGEHFMTAPDPGMALAALVAAAEGIA
jgi:indole-3-glycerol phosphate synthase